MKRAGVLSWVWQVYRPGPELHRLVPAKRQLREAFAGQSALRRPERLVRQPEPILWDESKEPVASAKDGDASGVVAH